MLEFGNVARVLLLWVTALKHRAATSPPPSDPAGEDHAKNEGGPSSVTTDVVHDPWWLSPVTSFLQNFTMTFVESSIAMETFCRLVRASRISYPFLPALSSPPSAGFIAYTLCALLGAQIRLACYSTLGRFYTFRHTTFTEHRIIRTGPYGYVRHPAYVGSALMRIGVVGVLTYDGGWINSVAGPILGVSGNGQDAITKVIRFGSILFVGWSAAEVVALFARAPREDVTLRKRFGHEWDDYRKGVPYRFIPYVI